MPVISGRWLAAAAIFTFSHFVLGLAGFGNALVAMGLLPFVMLPATAIVVLTIYTVVMTLAIFYPVRHHVIVGGVVHLVIGTVLGTPVGVWILATFPASTLNRLIGAVLVVVVLMEWTGVYPERLRGRYWGLGAGFMAGVAGGAVGTPGPPAVLYVTTQGWSPKTIKANLQAFFFVNQAVILGGYWWAGLIDREVWRLSASFAVPAAVGTTVGILLFNRIDQLRFRRIVFGLLMISGVILLVRG